MDEKVTTWRWLAGSLLLASALAMGGWAMSGASVRDGTDEDDEDDRYRSAWRLGSGDAGSAAESGYQAECGGCHLAYPPELLPPQSWERLMAELPDHFGSAVRLRQATAEGIRDYLLDNAAGRNRGGRFKPFLAEQGEPSIPVRITQLDYFIREHDEIPARLIDGEQGPLAMNDCEACHEDAAKGDFDEDRIRIPGVGRWDD